MRCSVGVRRTLVAVVVLVASALAKAQGGANFTFEPQFPTPGTPVHFTDSSPGSPSAWLWSFGDTSSPENGSMLQNPTHTYNQPGNYSVTLIVSGGASTGKVVTVATPSSSCLDSPAALCLHNSRFRVTANWTKASGETGTGTAFRLTDDSGYFWFFDPANIEMVVKVLDGCALTHAYWVFAAGLTNVQVNWLVTDTVTGATYVGVNEQGTPFAPVQQTNAFPTSCP